MSAIEKNRQALVALFGSDELVAMLTGKRIAVTLPPVSTPPSAVLLATVLSDTLGRLWPNLDFSGEQAEIALGVSQEAARSGGAPTGGLRVAWEPPYDLVVSIGAPAPQGASPSIQVGADGWHAAFGEGATCGESLNPVGPAFAAGLAAAQVFRSCFERELTGSGAKPLGSWVTDVRELFNAQGLELADIDLGETHVFGVGAVTHGMAWLLEKWPRKITGDLNLVDSDNYGSGNGQRYAFMRPGSAGTSKVEAIAERLRGHAQLTVTPHSKDMNTYCQDHGYKRPLERVVTGLDSEEARRQAALKCPKRTINMWTSESYIGAGQYVPGQGRGCLFCAYPEPVDNPMDEVARFHRHTGLNPEVVRELLSSSRALTAQEALKVSTEKGIPLERIQGEPLRSVLPVLCATGRVLRDDAKGAVDVPFSFSSLLAGVAGFVMLLRDVQLSADVSEGWNQHVFKTPSSLMLSSQQRHPRCVRCNAAELLQTARKGQVDKVC